MAVAIGDKVVVRVNMTCFSQKLVSSFWYRVEAVGTLFNPVSGGVSIATDFIAMAAAPYGALRACLSPEVNIDNVQAQFIAPARYSPGTVAVGLLGTNANSTDSVNQAAVITKGCDLAGRHYIGSLHIPALGAANMALGLVSAVYQGLMTTVATKMLNVLALATSGAQLAPIIYNRANHALSPIVTRTLVQDTARVMRRRTVGLGS